MYETKTDYKIIGNQKLGLYGATMGFFIGFAAVTLFGPTSNKLEVAMGLNATLVGLLVAIPNLTGSLFSDASTMIFDGTDGKLMTANINLIGETGNTPVDTVSVDSWLEVTVNGATKYIPLYD